MTRVAFDKLAMTVIMERRIDSGVIQDIPEDDPKKSREILIWNEFFSVQHSMIRIGVTASMNMHSSLKRLYLPVLSAAFLIQSASAQESNLVVEPGVYFGGALAEQTTACISEMEWRLVEEQIRQYEEAFGPLSSGALAAPQLFPFYPMAGNLYQDLFPGNYVDLDPGSGILDWDCTQIAYDGHDASDVVLRTFEEQDIGVPIFSALDGVVVATHDGEFDKNTTWAGQPANYVIVDHGGGCLGYYWHMRKNSVAVSVGQNVAAGEHIGMTASSGVSTYPHLHFATYVNGVVFEPYAGNCRPGSSGWENQIPIRRDTYLYDCAVSYEHPRLNGGPPWPMPRSGQIALTDSNTHFWVIAPNLPANSNWRLRLIQPNNSVAYDWTGPFNGNPFYLWSWWWWCWDVPEMHSITGTWHAELYINGSLETRAPIEVRDQRTSGFNRPPEPITVAMDPQQPDVSDVITCSVATDLCLDDLDYDVLTYNYAWTINGQPARNVSHAGHADRLKKGLTNVGDSVQCTVTVSDGSAFASPVSDSVVVGQPSLKLNPPNPGVAGTRNAFAVDGATSGNSVHYAYSLQAGSASVPSCPGVSLGLRFPILFGQATANGSGRAELAIDVPRKARGRTVFLQTVELATCIKSNMLQTAFQ